MLTTFLTLMTGFAAGAVVTAVVVSVAYLVYSALDVAFGEDE
jgi:hypothetical protein